MLCISRHSAPPFQMEEPVSLGTLLGESKLTKFLPQKLAAKMGNNFVNPDLLLDDNKKKQQQHKYKHKANT